MFKRSEQSSGNPWPARKTWAIVLLILVLAVVTAIRIRLLDFPLERDEGEYAYAGQLLLQGASPYEHAYNVTLKLPGTCVAYALILAVFGQTPDAIHAGIILINLASAMLVFVLARRIGGVTMGAIAGSAYALLSIIPVTLGLAAHATHFVVLFALAGIVVLQKLDATTSSRRIFLAGLLLGLALLMKQTGLLFGVFSVAWIIYSEKSFRDWRRLAMRLIWLATGGLLPLAATCIILALRGEFGRFWFWTFQYAGAHGNVFTFGYALKWMLVNVGQQFTAAPGLWGLSVLGLFLLFREPSLRPWRIFILGFALCSFLAVCPGWYFRGHYFIQLLPAAGLLIGVTFSAAARFFARTKFSFSPTAVPLLIFTVASASSLIQWNDIYFRLSPAQACRNLYGTNPFPEAVEISRYLAAHTSPEARIAVIGSEPEIFFYSHRRSATGYICTYPLVEPQPYAAAMQNEMFQEIEKADPAYVVFVNIPGSWVQSTAHTGNAVFDWFDQYQREHLQLIGLVKIMPDQQTEYRWLDPRAASSVAYSEYSLTIFKNRSSGGEALSK